MWRAAKIGLGVIAILTFAGYAAFTLFEQHRFLEKIPDNIEVSSGVRISGDRVTGSCGVAIFRLSRKSRDLMLGQGLKFFEDARQARGFTDVYHSYEPWRPTPIVGGLTDSSELAALPLGMGCAFLSRALKEEIVAAAVNPGSYFTRKPGGALLVSPESQLVVFAVWD